MKRPLEIALWCDCETDQERADFLRSGRAWETGIIANSIVEEVAQVFEFREAYKPRLEHVEFEIDRMYDRVLRAKEVMYKVENMPDESNGI